MCIRDSFSFKYKVNMDSETRRTVTRAPVSGLSVASLLLALHKYITRVIEQIVI